MIARELRKHAVAKEVAPTVAAPDAGEMGSVHHKRHQRRTQNGSVAGARHRTQVEVDPDDSRFELGKKLGGRGARRERLQRRHDGSARDVSPAMAAHAVGDRPEADVGAREHTVFVQVAHQSDVGDAARPESEGAGHGTSLGIAGFASAKAPVSISANRTAGGRPT